MSSTLFIKSLATTFEQNFFGDLNLVTVEPKNIQALLATQFNDFSLGGVRATTSSLCSEQHLH
jgi:hypothetical protein